MGLTVILLLFMVLVPFKLKKAGIELMLDKNKQGFLLFLLSKVFWWFPFVLVCYIWVEQKYILFAWMFVLVGIMLRLFADRKHFGRFNIKK